jgi:hypothetical protein
MSLFALRLLAWVLIWCITISVDTISDVSECLLSDLFLLYLFKHFIHIEELLWLLSLLVECNITIAWSIAIHIGIWGGIGGAYEAFIDGGLVFDEECAEIIHLHLHCLQWLPYHLIDEALCYRFVLFLLWVHIVLALVLLGRQRVYRLLLVWVLFA